MFAQIIRFAPNGGAQTARYATSWQMVQNPVKGNIPPLAPPSVTPKLFLIAEPIGPDFTAEGLRGR